MLVSSPSAPRLLFSLAWPETDIFISSSSITPIWKREHQSLFLSKTGEDVVLRLNLSSRGL